MIIPDHFNHYAGKRMKKRIERLKFGIPNHFWLLGWKKRGKSVKWWKLSIPNRFGPLWWEKCEITKLGHSKSFWTNWWEKCEITKLGHSKSFGPLWWEKIGKKYKMGKRLEKVWNDQNWAFQIILDHFWGERLEKVQNKIECSKWFYMTLVGKDWKKEKWPKLGNLNHFGPLLWEKIGKSVK